MSIKSNITLYYLFNLFRQSFFFAPVVVLFFQANNLSMTEILLLQSIYSIAIVLLEVPTGAIGDYFGKKISISIGAFLFFLGLSIYSIGTSFTIFLIAELVAGIGSSLISGSDSALIHGSLKNIGKEKDYKKVEGTANSFLLTGFLIAGLIGGYIGGYSLRLTMICSAVSAFIVFIISLFFTEPKIKVEGEKEAYKELIINSIEIVRENKLLLWLIFYSAILTAFAYVLGWYYQLFFIKVNIDVVYFGWLYALLGIIAIVSSKYTHQIEIFFGNKGSLILLSSLIIIPSILLGKIASIFAVSLFAFHQIFRGISKVIFNERILSVIPSSKSATILSINNLGNRFFFALLGPIFGYLTDAYSLEITLLSLGISVFSISIIMVVIYNYILNKSISKSQAP